MQRALIAVLILAAGFVWFTSRELPPELASHFGAGGGANGYSGRATYTTVMLVVVVGVPLVVGLTGQLVRGLRVELINLPNRDYWLAPERRAASLEALSSLTVPFAMALAAFLCFMHWLVVRANAVQPARLSETPMFAGLAAFGVVVVLWLVLLFRRFGRVTSDSGHRRAHRSESPAIALRPAVCAATSQSRPTQTIQSASSRTARRLVQPRRR